MKGMGPRSRGLLVPLSHLHLLLPTSPLAQEYSEQVPPLLCMEALSCLVGGAPSLPARRVQLPLSAACSKGGAPSAAACLPLLPHVLQPLAPTGSCTCQAFVHAILFAWATTPWTFSLPPKATSSQRPSLTACLGEPPLSQLLPLSEITSLVCLLTGLLSVHPMDGSSMKAGPACLIKTCGILPRGTSELLGGLRMELRVFPSPLLPETH